MSIIQVDDSNHDHIAAICYYWAHSLILWKIKHVASHQDNQAPISTLDKWAILNIELDLRAKQHQHIARQCPGHFSLKHESWSLWFHQRKIVSDLSNTVYDLVHSKEDRGYWLTKDSVTEDSYSLVHWDALGTAMKESKRTTRFFCLKTCLRNVRGRQVYGKVEIMRR